MLHFFLCGEISFITKYVYFQLASTGYIFARPLELDGPKGVKGAKGSGHARGATQTPQAEEQISYQEVQKHNKREDCWIVVRGQVCDRLPWYYFKVINAPTGIQVSSQSSIPVALLRITHSVTDFIPKHPGGDKIIISNAGKDVTYATLCLLYMPPT